MVTPVVYIFYGEDTFGVEQELAAMQARMGDESLVAMNVTHLDGNEIGLDELRATATTAPFLTGRRMVIVKNLLAKFTHPTSQQKLLQLLDGLPDSTALVLWEERGLKSGHWLLRWAGQAEGRAFTRAYGQVRGEAMARWIQTEAKSSGGDFSPGGARSLAGLVGADKRHAAREIEKLLAYANYARPVDEDDVQHVAVSAEEEDSSQIFQLVDALGHQQGQVALDLLHQLLGLREPLSIFGMIVRQFRLLLISREILDGGGAVEAIREKLDLHPYVAGKVMAQARNFDLPTLEAIYHKLGHLDLSIKTGGISATTALDTLIADLTAARL